MKNTITTCLFLCLALCTSCTVDEMQDTKKSEMLNNKNSVVGMVNRLAKNVQNTTGNSQKKQSLQDLIHTVEAQALQDPDFANLVNNQYTTPQAADIEAVLTDADGVLNNLAFSATAKTYMGSILNTTKATAIDSLVQTITISNQLTTEEKALLYDLADLQKEYLLNDDGDDNNLRKNKIIGYAQGYHQTKANAVLNAVIIQILAQP